MADLDKSLEGIVKEWGSELFIINIDNSFELFYELGRIRKEMEVICQRLAIDHLEDENGRITWKNTLKRGEILRK